MTEPESTTQFASDRERTARRYRELEEYYASRVFDAGGGRFCCTKETECRDSISRPGVPFSTGQLSYLGADYDLTRDGRDLRILVVSMEAGQISEFDGPGYSMSERSAQIGRTAQQNVRGPRKTTRNPHMRGTTTALRVLVGLDAPSRSTHDEALTDDIQLLDAFALVNARLCSAAVGMTSVASTKMTKNCSHHLQAAIATLEPTVCVVQQEALKWMLDDIFDDRTSLAPDDPLLRDRVERCTVSGVQSCYVWLSHPSGRAKGWAGDRGNYLHIITLPALRLARDAI